MFGRKRFAGKQHPAQRGPVALFDAAALQHLDQGKGHRVPDADALGFNQARHAGRQFGDAFRDNHRGCAGGRGGKEIESREIEMEGSMVADPVSGG
ncbi:hypothetical protein SDC9_197001 [bioreactor metagenome]|uniref:Uncharacterized protein n=1 Tax=bioreactor metagenome TaxID=1076179 RepID=A0A645IDH0_9ZZZZ